MRLGVSENSVIHPLVQRLEDRRRGSEIHVGDPERIQFRLPVILDAAGAAAVDGRVEIEIHRAAFLTARGGGGK